MGKMSLEIDDDIELRFRHKVLKVFGSKKGAISRGAERAFVNWCGSDFK